MMYSSALSLVMIICVSTMMKSEKRKAPPTARAVSVSSLPTNTWRKPPRMRIRSPVDRAACRLEKSRLVYNGHLIIYLNYPLHMSETKKIK